MKAGGTYWCSGSVTSEDSSSSKWDALNWLMVKESGELDKRVYSRGTALLLFDLFATLLEFG